ncbi:MAG: hypothetical protein K0B10_13340 [Vicingaceae bacterium]|nr:hypothetical protein [Vicingaceae bacterium]
MVAIELNNDWVLSSEDYQIKEEPTSLGDNFIRFYSRMLHKYYARLSHQRYSPKELSPQQAISYLKVIVKEKRAFKKLLRMYEKVIDYSPEINKIYHLFVAIVDELEIAEERLEKLSDPEIHSRLLRTVNQLEYSSFMRD